MRVYLSFPLLVIAINGVQAFMPRTRTPQARVGVVAPRMASFSPDDEKSAKKPMEMNEKDAVTTFDDPQKGLTPIQKAFWALSSAASYSITSFSVAVSLGFMLNIFGFAYQISWDHGLEIESIGKMREINQFRAEVKSRPPSALPK